MEYSWRVTKYNPLLRDTRGGYLYEEWTSYSDIGECYPNGIFTVEEYLDIEARYISAIETFMKYLGISSLQVTCLEKHGSKIQSDSSNELTLLQNKIREGDTVSADRLRNICKLILRENIWCKLEHSQKMFVHFGFDYYMYIGCSIESKEALEEIMQNGLFVEPFHSPYMDEE